jgi:hypothetical protein
MKPLSIPLKVELYPQSPVTTKPTDFNTSDWFFLPAAGRYLNGTLGYTGTYGDYWLSTAGYSSTMAEYIVFGSTSIGVSFGLRYLGDRLWSVQ